MSQKDADAAKAEFDELYVEYLKSLPVPKMEPPTIKKTNPSGDWAYIRDDWKNSPLQFSSSTGSIAVLARSGAKKVSIEEFYGWPAFQGWKAVDPYHTPNEGDVFVNIRPTDKHYKTPQDGNYGDVDRCIAHHQSPVARYGSGWAKVWGCYRKVFRSSSSPIFSIPMALP